MKEADVTNLHEAMDYLESECTLNMTFVTCTCYQTFRHVIINGKVYLLTLSEVGA